MNEPPSLSSRLRAAAEEWRTGNAPQLDNNPHSDSHWTWLITGLDATALRRLARYWRNMARLAESRATTLDQWATNERAAKSLLASLSTLPQTMEEYIAAGMTPEAAAQATAQTTGNPIETVHHYWRQHQRAQTEADAQRRAMKVMRLASQGLSNIEIGHRLGLHPGSVSRIISKQLGRKK